MATLRRCHAPVPWGARVEMTVWERSRPGKPRRRRTDKPSLTHDPGWDWDGPRILSSDKSVTANEDGCAWESHAQPREDAHSPSLSGRTHATLSILDIARYQVKRRHGKARSSLDDFEVIRVPRVVPVSEDEPDLGDIWELREWEKLEALGFKRTYSEVAQGFVDRRDPPNGPGCSRLVMGRAEDDPWECL